MLNTLSPLPPQWSKFLKTKNPNKRLKQSKRLPYQLNMEQAYLILSGRPRLLPLMLMFLLGASEDPGPLQPSGTNCWEGPSPSSLLLGDGTVPLSVPFSLHRGQGVLCTLGGPFQDTLGSSGLGSHRSNMRPFLTTSGERDLWVVPEVTLPLRS